MCWLRWRASPLQGARQLGFRELVYFELIGSLGAVPFSLDLAALGHELRYRYRLVKRPQQVVESNPAICSGQPVFRGTRIPVAVVVEQLRAGTPRQELEGDFPQLS